ncbi:unnamed protein product, partial [Polarella glacialis]
MIKGKNTEEIRKFNIVNDFTPEEEAQVREVQGREDTIKARVPEGMGPGSTLVLCQLEGTDEWVEESTWAQAMATVPVGAQEDHTQELFGQDSLAEEDSLVPDGPVAYTVRLDTTSGIIDIIVRPDWAPHGARRFLQLAQAGDLDGLSFYRSVKGCLAQFGLPARRQWPPLQDDAPTGVPFLLGAVCFAAVGQNSRKSTLFVCTGDMSHCFGQSPWETPIGAVAEASLDALDRIETVYGDIAECGGTGPDTGRIHAEGDEYLRTNFPQLTYIRTARPLDWPPLAEAFGSVGAGLEGPYRSAGSVAGSITDQATLPAAQMMQAAEAVRAVFQGPSAVGSAHSMPAGSTSQNPGQPHPHASQQPLPSLPIEVPVEVRRPPAGTVTRTEAHPVLSSAQRGSALLGGSASSVSRTPNVGAAPLRFSAAPGSYVLPSGGGSVGGGGGCYGGQSFEHQAQAQAHALVQAQHTAQLHRPVQQDQPVTHHHSLQTLPLDSNVRYTQGSRVVSNGTAMGSHAPPISPPYAAATGSYVPPPGSFVPPPGGMHPMHAMGTGPNA